MRIVIKYVILDLVRNRVIFFYTLLLLLLSSLLLGLDENTSKGILSILNMTLLFVPIISILFSTIYLYNSIEFTELLLAMPLRRNHLIKGQYIALSGSLALAYLVGIGIPAMIFAGGMLTMFLLLTGVLLTLIFTSFAALVYVSAKDKTKGIGISIIIALFFTLLYDGILMAFIYSFSDYPIEKTIIALVATNPVDLARVFMLLHLDVAVLLGYSGALFKNLLGSAMGSIFCVSCLLVWVVAPMFLTTSIFRRKDL
jgi:Cu-processing system permease protein